MKPIAIIISLLFLLGAYIFINNYNEREIVTTLAAPSSEGPGGDSHQRGVKDPDRVDPQPIDLDDLSITAESAGSVEVSVSASSCYMIGDCTLDAGSDYVLHITYSQLGVASLDIIPGASGAASCAVGQIGRSTGGDGDVIDQYLVPDDNRHTIQILSGGSEFTFRMGYCADN